MRFSKTLAVLFLSGSVLAAPTESFVRHERRDTTTSKWIKRSSAPSGAKLPLRINLKQRNAHLGHDHLMDIADPASASFGKHWTSKEISEFFAPHQENVDSVNEWLENSGIDRSRITVTGGRGAVTLYVTVSEAEALLNTKYHVYEHAESGSLSVSCDEYSVHHSVRDHVDFVTPTIGFAEAHKIKRQPAKRQVKHKRHLANSRRAGNLTTCNEAITPDCIRALYDIPTSNTPQPGNELGIYESLGEVFDQEDLNLYFSTFATNIPNGTHPIIESVDGAVGETDETSEGTGEALLDIELAYPLIYPQQVKLFPVLNPADDANGSFQLWDVFLDALDASYCTYDGGDDPQYDPKYPNAGYNSTEMCGTYTPPNVISISYGGGELGPKYDERACHEFMKLGLQGTTIVVSSGDHGTAGVQYECSGDSAGYVPQFPASCPYVTTVGATMIQSNSTVEDPETAMNSLSSVGRFTNGGGFSNLFKQPAYQSDAVSAYLDSSVELPDPETNMYNVSGRAYPDVSANGVNIATFIKGEISYELGTSAAAPIFASIITLINQQRLAANKCVVGFINPTLYNNPGAFNDITDGVNWDCNNNTAFRTSEGWDPVTGLGTPSFPKLLDVFMKLP